VETFVRRVVVSVVLAACGGPAPPPTPTETAGDEAGVYADVLGNSGPLPEDGDEREEPPGAIVSSTAPPSDPPAQTVPDRPAGHVPAHDLVAVPELAAAEALAAEARAFVIGIATPVVTLDRAMEILGDQVADALQAVSVAVDAYEAVADDTTLDAGLRAMARVRAADVRDDLAARLETFPFAVPTDLATASRRASAEVRAEIEMQVLERVHREMHEVGRQLACAVLLGYVIARESAPPGSWAELRIAEQLAAYGSAFIASCDAAD
jgi:hypothetical protein